MIGKTISHYKILEKLGEGGMGEVYKAEDIKLKRTVAIKFLPPHLTRNKEAKNRFTHEAQAASALEHNNICNIHEIDQTGDDQLFVVMACYEGEDLKEKIERDSLNIDEAIDIAIQVSQGLEKAHEKGIVHRDIKPSNIFITTDGIVKIIDFGLAKLAGRTILTKEGSTLGTVDYMSPEQTRGGEVDQRTDIWSLGVMLYQMITGQLPFKGDYDQAVIYSILNEEPEQPTSLSSDMSLELERIILKALAKTSDDRYQNITELLLDLKVLTGQVEKRAPKVGIPKRRRKSSFAIAAVLIILTFATSYYFFWGNEASINSIAVLPLENLSGDPEQEYLVDGIHDELISNLARIKALTVISRTSVMQYKEVKKPLPQIAQDLNVDAIVEGTVRREGNVVRITVQLIEAAEDRHLWVNNYERDLTNIFELQSEVAKAIASEVHITLTPQEREQFSKAGSIDPQAYELYQQGRYHARKFTKAEMEKAIEYFKQAITREPDFAQAFSALAATYKHYSDLYEDTDTKETMLANARVHLIKALELDDGIGEAHAWLGWQYYLYDWDWSNAQKEFERALQLNPSNSTTHHLYSLYLTGMGRIEEATKMMARAVTLDPLNFFINSAAYTPYYFAGQYDKAIEQLQRALELNPHSIPHLSVLFGRVYVQKLMYNEAIDEYKKALEFMNEENYWYQWTMAFLGHAYGLAGREDEAGAILEKLEPQAEKSGIPVGLALVCLSINDKEGALQWLEKAYNWREHQVVQWLKADPAFDSLRSNPHFQDILIRLNLPKSLKTFNSV